MSTTQPTIPTSGTTSDPSVHQTEISKIIGLLFTVGVAAASIFVKNANHRETAGKIVSVLNGILPDVQSML